MFIVKKIGLALVLFLLIGIVSISIHFAGNVDIWGYEKDLEKRIPFTKEELIIYGMYDKNVASFETNYGNKLIYTFPENTSMEKMAKFTKENVGQVAEIKIESVQDALTNVFNIKVQQ